MDFRSTEVNQYLTLIVSKIVAIDIQEDKMSEHQPCRRAFSSLYWLAFMAVFCISGSGSVSASIANNNYGKMLRECGFLLDNVTLHYHDYWTIVVYLQIQGELT